MLPFSSLFIIIGAISVVALMLLLYEKRKNRDMEEKERKQNAMIALVSHQLRTPLSSIKWHIEMLLSQDFGKLQIAQLELLDKVNGSIANAIDVLNAFLETSTVERGAESVQPIALDVRTHLQRAIDSLADLTKEKDQTIVTNLPDGHLVAFVDPILFHTIFTVLLRNAATYTAKKGTIHIDASADDDRVTVSVRDAGIGMSVAEQKQLFTKFFRGEKGRTLDTRGNGLGLYLAKRLLDLTGGSIRCESKMNEGTTFTVSLPKN